MIRKVQKERIEIEGGGEDRFNAYLHLKNETNRGVKTPDDPWISPDDVEVRFQDESSDWTTQFISYEEDPERVAKYRFWRSRCRDLRITIRNLTKSVGKDFFSRLVRRFGRFYTLRKWTGEYRIDHHYRQFVQVSDAVWQMRPSEYYQSLLRARVNDEKAKVWINNQISYLAAHPEEDSVMLTWIQSPGEPPPELGKLVKPAGTHWTNRVAVTARPVTSRKRVWGPDWDKVRERFHDALAFRDRKIAGYRKLLRIAESQALKFAFSSGGCPNRECFQQSSNSGIKIPKVDVWKHNSMWQLQQRLATQVDDPSDFAVLTPPSDLEGGQVEMSVTAYALESVYKPVTLADVVPEDDAFVGMLDPTNELLSRFQSRGLQFVPNPARSLSQEQIGKLRDHLPFMADLNDSQLLHEVLREDEQGKDRLKFHHDTWNPENCGWRKESCSVDPLPEAEGYEEALRATAVQGNPSHVTIVAPNLDDDKIAFENARLLNHKRLLALDLPEHRFSPEFNIMRSIGELKDTPLTVRTGADFMKWCSQRGAAETFMEFKPQGGGKKVRYALPTCRDELTARFVMAHGPNPRPGLYPRFAKKMGFSSVRVVSIQKALVPQLAALYLCWKFGVSQTLNDIKTIMQSGTAWAFDARKGLTEVLRTLDNTASHHVVGRSYRVTPTIMGGMPGAYERRAPRDPNGLRPFLEQEVTIPYALEPETVLTSLTAREALRYYRSLGGILNANWPWKLPNGMPVVPIPESGLALLAPDIPWTVASRWIGPDHSVIESFNSSMDVALQSWLGNKGIGTQTVVMAVTATGRHWAKWSLAGLKKALRVDRIEQLLLGYDCFLVAWELTPLSFVVEWFTNIRQLIQSANADMKTVLGKIAAPISKVWEHYRIRLWAGCPHRSESSGVNVEYREPTLELLHWHCHAWGFDPRRQRIWHRFSDKYILHAYYTSTNLKAWSVKGIVVNCTLRKTRIRRFFRHAAGQVAGMLPTFRAKIQLTVGKLFSLAAMAVAR